LLFDAGDIDQLAASIQRLTPSDIRTMMGVAGANRVRNQFTERRMLIAYEDALVKLCATAPH
jgi:hypothetical protein